ncbi:MAG: phytase [Acidimicrobiia bacterium]
MDGRIEQWELFDGGTGKVDARPVRGPWSVVGGQIEGCVADDELGQLYVSEERRGVWRYGADPTDPTGPTLIDATGSSGHLPRTSRGLAILPGPPGNGYLFASSQGDNAFAVYRREAPNSFLGRFRVGPGPVDGCEDTDGIEVTGENLGPAFPSGLFVCQDGGDKRATNFKLVSLEQILRSLPDGPAPSASSSASPTYSAHLLPGRNPWPFTPTCTSAATAARRLPDTRRSSVVSSSCCQ